MSLLGRLARDRETRDFINQHYGSQAQYEALQADGNRRAKFSRALRDLIDTWINAKKIDRADALAVLRGEIESARQSEENRVAARNTTTPRVFSGNLAEHKFPFPFSKKD